MTKPIVLIAEELSPATVDALGPDFDIRNVDGTDRPALLAALATAHAVLIRSATQIDAEAIAAAPVLKVVARAGVGLDNVDITAATTAGVMVVNAPTSNIISAAELTIGHILSLARQIPAAHASLAAGEWQRSKYTGVELYEKRVGIIGLGRIGALIAARLQAFGVDVVAYDPYITEARAQQLGATLLPLDELLSTSDFVTIHMPKTPETTGMIGAAELKNMKSTAFVINVARGGLIDEAALAAALRDGEIAGAGIDVFTSEPPTDDLLTSAPNIVVTPHLGASTAEAQDRAGVVTAEQVSAALSGGVVTNAVNIAAVRPEAMEALAPFVPLCEKLGRLAQGLGEGSVDRVTAELLRLLDRHALSSTAFRRTGSLLSGRLGQRVLDPSCHLVDDATDAAGAPFPFDLFGYAKRPVKLIEAGVARSPAVDAELAQELGLPPTPHAISPEESRPEHLFLRPGGDTESDLLERADGGVWIGHLEQVGCFDPATLRFTAAARGIRRVEGGRLGAAVPDCTWEDDVPRLLGELAGIGSDAACQPGLDGFWGAITTPAVAVPEIRLRISAR